MDKESMTPVSSRPETSGQRKEKILRKIIDFMNAILGPSYLNDDDCRIYKETKELVEMVSGGEFTMTASEFEDFKLDFFNS